MPRTTNKLNSRACVECCASASRPRKLISVGAADAMHQPCERMHNVCARVRINRVPTAAAAKSKSIDFASEICIRTHHTVCAMCFNKMRERRRKEKQRKRIAKTCFVCCAHQSICVLVARMHRSQHHSRRANEQRKNEGGEENSFELRWVCIHITQLLL